MCKFISTYKLKFNNPLIFKEINFQFLYLKKIKLLKKLHKFWKYTFILNGTYNNLVLILFYNKTIKNSIFKNILFELKNYNFLIFNFNYFICFNFDFMQFQLFIEKTLENLQNYTKIYLLLNYNLFSIKNYFLFFNIKYYFFNIFIKNYYIYFFRKCFLNILFFIKKIAYN